MVKRATVGFFRVRKNCILLLYVKPVTLKLNKEYKRAYYRGSYKAGPLLVTYMVKNNRRMIRYGITTGKKIGNAVKRNRSRRIIRAAFRQLLDDFSFSDFPEGLDFVFVAREKTPEAKSTDLYKAMRYQVSHLLSKQK